MSHNSRKPSTTRLPQSLLEKIQEKEGNTPNDDRLKKNHFKLSRKELRKQGRGEKRQRKAEHFSVRSREAGPVVVPSKKRPASQLEDNPPQRPVKQQKIQKVKEETLQTPSVPRPSTSAKSHEISQTPLERLAAKPTAGLLSFSKRLSERKTDISFPEPEYPEDKEIALLEAKLGLKKRKGSHKKGVLYEIFDELDKFADLDPSESPNEEEGSEALWNQEFGAGSDSDENESYSESTDDPDVVSESAGEEDDADDTDGELKSAEGVEDTAIDLQDPEEEKKIQRPTEKYMPPHLRESSVSTSKQRPETSLKQTESSSKLSRQLKGLLNKLSEQNIESILGEVEAIYRNHPRNDVTTILTSLILDSITMHSSLLDAFVILHASLVCSLYKIVGVDVAAYFLQTLVSSYEEYHAQLRATEAPESATDDPPNGKECINLLVLVSELYNFQVISCVLMYDIIRDLLSGDLKEFDVELLLKLIRNSGSQLRQDDPLALKDIVQIVQSKLSNKEARTLSSRVRFMIETLTNLKNNKIKHNSAQTGGEAQERLKKFLSGLKKKHHILAHEPLQVSLEDLHSSQTKGKWWLVGAAWAGDPLAEQQDQGPSKTSIKLGDSVENALLKVAKKQGMNTDVRRSIFVVLMSSDDYIDARERLGQLKLTEIQQREIIRVVLHCCGNEGAYNPYYTLVGQSLSETSHAFKITLQYCLWDFLRDLGEVDVGGAELIKNTQDSKTWDDNHVSRSRVQNIAKAYAWWIAKGTSSLMVLKPLDFSSLQPQTHEFLRILLAQVFIGSQSTSPATNLTSADNISRDQEPLEVIILKAAKNSNLARGILHFISGARLERLGKSDHVKEFLKWGVEVTKDTLRVGMDVMGARA